MSDHHPQDEATTEPATTPAIVTPKRNHRLAFVVIALAAIGGLVAAIVAAVDDPEPEQIAISPAAAMQDADGADDADEGDVAEPADDTAGVEDRADVPVAESAPMSEAAEILPIECVDGEYEEYVPTAEEIAANNEDTEALAAVFTAAGIAHEIETDDLGFSWVEYDYDDAVAQAVANSHYATLYPDEGVFIDEGEYEIPEEELAQIREENAGLIAALEAAGIAYEVIAEEGGYEWVEFDYEDPAAQEVVDAYYNELYPPEPIPEEELALIREENAALIAELEAAGIAYEVITEEGGYEWVEWDYEDPAAQEVVDGFYMELYGEGIEYGECAFPVEEWEPTAEDLALAEAEVAELSAILDAVGIDYTIAEDEQGWRWVEWDYEDPAAQEAVDAYYMADLAEFNEQANARLDELAAAFDAAGVSYEREGHEDCPTILFDTTDDAALAAVAGLFQSA